MDIITRYFDDPIIPGRACDSLIPRNVSKRVGLFAIHGGGWHAGDRAGLHKILWPIAKQGYACASAGYRLTMGKGSLAKKLEDIRIGFNLFRKAVKRKGVDRFVFYGSSAGAHLAYLAALAPPGTFGEPTDALQLDTPPALIVSCGPVTFKPWREIFPGIHSTMQSLIGCSYDENPQAWEVASPDRYVNENASPIFIIQAANEHLFPNDLAKRHATKWRKRGVDVTVKQYAHAEHGFLYDVGPRDCQRNAHADVLAFLDRMETSSW